MQLFKNDFRKIPRSQCYSPAVVAVPLTRQILAFLVLKTAKNVDRKHHPMIHVPEQGLMFSIHYLTESCVTFLDAIIVILRFVVLSFHFDSIMILKMLKRLSILLKLTCLLRSEIRIKHVLSHSLVSNSLRPHRTVAC